MVLKKTQENLQSSERYGWELNDTSLDPIMTDNLGAPLVLIIETSICSYKGVYSTRKCKFFKIHLYVLYV